MSQRVARRSLHTMDRDRKAEDGRKLDEDVDVIRRCPEGVERRPLLRRLLPEQALQRLVETRVDERTSIGRRPDEMNEDPADGVRTDVGKRTVHDAPFG